MRLNMDCVRDILLCVEANASQRAFCIFLDTGEESALDRKDYQVELDSKYGNEALIYHVRYCIDSGLIKTLDAIYAAVKNCTSWDEYAIFDLSVSGHDLISKIRDDNRWTGVKKALPSIRNYSLDAINAISQGMTSVAISAYLSKNP